MLTAKLTWPVTSAGQGHPEVGTLEYESEYEYACATKINLRY